MPYSPAELEILYSIQDTREEPIFRSIHFLEALKFKTIAECTSEQFFKDKVMIAYSDASEKCPLVWEALSTKGYSRWEELRHDKETNFGKSPPRDMLYAFVLLPWSPAFRLGSDLQKHFQHLWKSKHPTLPDPIVPPLKHLKPLLGCEMLTNGMWIILVRMPRPAHGKIHIPLSMRKEYTIKFKDETESDWQVRRTDLKRKAEAESHPTESQLYLTQNQTLIQEVGKHIVCSKCGAKGHHHEKSHDDVYSEGSREVQDFLSETPSDSDLSREWQIWKHQRAFIHVSCAPCYPDWMNVKPYPKETIVLTKLLDEDKGLTLQIRQAETKIPLRLARKLMMDGLVIEGEVYASGVGSRKRVRREAEEEAEKLKKILVEESRPVFQHLYIDIQEEERLDLEYRQGMIQNFLDQARLGSSLEEK